MHQVLAAMTNGAGLVALALTGVTPGGGDSNKSNTSGPGLEPQSQQNVLERFDAEVDEVQRATETLNICM